MRNKIVSLLYDHCLQNENTYVLTADLGFNLFEDFFINLPNQFFNVGVSEQNMLAVAAGLAKEDAKVFVYSIGNFATMRCYEHIRNDICYHDLDVTVLSNGAGFSYGQLGFTHHATEDISFMRAIPNLEIFSPGSENEAELITEECLKTRNPKYVRIDKVGFTSKNIKTFNSNSSSKSQVLILATGGIAEEASSLEYKLAEYDLEVDIFSFPKIIFIAK